MNPTKKYALRNFIIVGKHYCVLICKTLSENRCPFRANGYSVKTPYIFIRASPERPQGAKKRRRKANGKQKSRPHPRAANDERVVEQESRLSLVIGMMVAILQHLHKKAARENGHERLEGILFVVEFAPLGESLESGLSPIFVEAINEKCRPRRANAP